MNSPNAWYGCRPDRRDARDHIFRPMAIRLPPQVDLRGFCPPVMDQGRLGSCTAHGITGALRYLLLSAGKPDEMLARLQLYYDERALEGSVSDDSGAEIRDGIKCAAKIGIAHENLWPYQIAAFKRKPSSRVYTDAKKFHALTYERVTISVSALQSALASGIPVIIGLTLYESFESDAVAKTGMIPMPDLRKEQMVGGHCMYCVGYKRIDEQNYFIVRNSWNIDWGDNGDCYFPAAYLGDPKYGSDYWVVNTVS